MSAVIWRLKIQNWTRNELTRPFSKKVASYRRQTVELDIRGGSWRHVVVSLIISAMLKYLTPVILIGVFAFPSLVSPRLSSSSPRVPRWCAASSWMTMTSRGFAAHSRSVLLFLEGRSRLRRAQDHPKAPRGSSIAFLLAVFERLLVHVESPKGSQSTMLCSLSSNMAALSWPGEHYVMTSTAGTLHKSKVEKFQYSDFAGKTSLHTLFWNVLRLHCDVIKSNGAWRAWLP